MSQRKLQQDIDKLLKKVKEGFMDFEDVYDKFQSTDPENTSYREKLESDLKREIKKLQKHRDQIKTWLSKEDVKDKQSILLENRKMIENGMERFKSVEKLMKTKQFSTEALTNPDIIKDPRELKKRDQLLFIQDCLEELQKQLEGHEAQEEQEKIERHEFNIHNLENILKLLQNNELEPDTVQEYQDDIKYYVENNDDPDFIEYDTIYEDMGCEIKPNQENTNSKDVTTDSPLPDSSNAKESSNTAASTTTATAVASTPNGGISSSVNGTPQGSKTLKKPEKSPKKKTQTGTPVSATETPSRVASASLAQASPTPENITLAQPDLNAKLESTNNNNNNNNAGLLSNKKKEVSQPPPELQPPKDRSKDIEEQIRRDLSEQNAFKNELFSGELKYWLRSKRPLMQPYEEMPERMLSQLESSLLNCPDSLDADSPHFYRKPLSLPHPTSIFFPNEPIRFVCPVDISPPPSQSTATNVIQHQQQRQQDSAQEQAENDAQEKGESEDIYSRTSLSRILRKFDLDTLFFIFYHYQGTYEQFLAARELAKNRKWKFNKVDRCWYYKEVEKLPPGMAQSEEESWRYFDYQRSWLARRCNSDFVQNEENFEKIL
ncbi:proteinral negative regulator of transcription subunit 5 [Zygosaccharomyces mellis]|uniref:General negative regulator of transcription subunit n=1 Tax=Zygosaccharomyces mellis TaxID=42258 RepID=A0A4C2E7B7_9SACH|nr:proteinral negative regulator of transcription subunit 5 [Zygosaccharomyces mellis]